MARAKWILWKLLSLFGAASAMIGIAGIPDDLARWQTWLQPLDTELGRWIAGTIGLFILANAVDLLGAIRALSGSEPTIAARMSHIEPVAGTPPLSVAAHRSGTDLGATLTPEYVANLFTTDTSARANAQLPALIDRPMEVAGTVADVTPWTNGRAMVFLEDRPSGFGPSRRVMVTMFFSGAWAERVSLLNRGTPVRVRGRLTAADASGVRLEHCELLEP